MYYFMLYLTYNYLYDFGYLTQKQRDKKYPITPKNVK